MIMKRQRGLLRVGSPAAVALAGFVFGAAVLAYATAGVAAEAGRGTACPPHTEAADPAPGTFLQAEADLRVVLDLDGATPAIEVRGADGAADAERGGLLAACHAVGRTRTFFDDHEGRAIEMLDVDLGVLLDCVHSRRLLDEGRGLDDETGGGLVLYFGVEGAAARYGVRVFNGARIASSVTGAPLVRGLTVVTSHALYVRGDYNSIDKRPAGFVADSLNILSNAWNDVAPGGGEGQRPAAATTINADFLAGAVDVAGLPAFPRFHENWSGTTLTYGGSFGSRGGSLHAEGAR